MDNIVLYDGECGFCNHWVQWILRNDAHRKFRFAALQGSFGQDFLTENHLPKENLDTIYFIKDEVYYSKLAAIAEIGKALGGMFSVLALLKILPRFVSVRIYDLVAKNRKKIAGESCLLPTAREKMQFID